jgi:hypothetical protein
MLEYLPSKDDAQVQAKISLKNKQNKTKKMATKKYMS